MIITLLVCWIGFVAVVSAVAIAIIADFFTDEEQP